MLEIQTGNAKVVVACGTENMSQIPYYIKDARAGLRMGYQELEDGLIDILTWPLGPYHNGMTAEAVAEKFYVSREEQGAFALESQQCAIAAIDTGKF
jgi:acetyl-CoA C-acetyltransferase